MKFLLTFALVAGFLFAVHVVTNRLLDTAAGMFR